MIPPNLGQHHRTTTDIRQYNYALYAYLNDLCAGIYGNYDTATGQSAETGRDQGHTLTGLGWAAEAARVIQSQGFDAYSEGDNLLMKAGEYSAKYNLGHEVPYDPKFYRCEAILVNGPWSAPSNISRGTTVPTWDVSVPTIIFAIRVGFKFTDFTNRYCIINTW